MIRDRILKGEYGIGERIKENQLAEEFRVSRTPIREAIKQLEAEGLIESIPNRGSFTRGFSKMDIEDIYAVRAVVEVLAVRWAVGRITDAEVGRLQEEYEIMEFYTNKKDGKKVGEINRRFHEIVYNASGRRFLIHTLKSYQEYVEQTRKVTVYCDDNLKSILAEHRGILDALKQRDENLAAERMRAHLLNSQIRAEVGMKIK